MANNEYVYTEEKRELIKEGAYECVIEKAAIAETSTGKQKIDLSIRIRSDVEQEHKNRVIYDTIWKDRDNEELFDKRKINRILGTQKIKEGTAFASINEVLATMQGSFLIANVGSRFSEYKGKDENFIKWYSESQNAPKSMPIVNNENITITEEDLPF